MAASSWDKLGQAASVMQVTGIDAFALVSMIVQAANTARRNRDLCQQLSQHVQVVGGLLGKLQIPELRRHPETRRPLEQLDDALFRAYKLVRSCSQQQENTSQLYQMFTGAEVASKLRAAMEEIDRYIQLIPMITLVAAVSISRRGTEEVHEDVTNDSAPTRRPGLSLQEVTEALALEALPPTGLSVYQTSRRNGWHQLIASARNGLFGRGGVYLTDGVNAGRLEDSQAGPRRFRYNELFTATQGFSDNNKIGEGTDSFPLYRGFLPDQGLDVVIRRVTSSSAKELGEITEALTIMNQLRHPNVVHLLGWCYEKNELFIVNEFIMNGNLDDRLHGPHSMLIWPIRYKVILGLGAALLYLHEGCEPPLLHRSIKPSNIMLDSTFNTKLTDFGLYGILDGIILGSLGYLDPHYVLTGAFGCCCDVYSFGIVLLEVASGQKPFELQGNVRIHNIHLVGWVWQFYGRNEILDAADARLGGNFDAREMERALVVGLWCAHPDVDMRPSIGQAMKVLRSEEPLPELPSEMPGSRSADEDDGVINLD